MKMKKNKMIHDDEYDNDDDDDGDGDGDDDDDDEDDDDDDDDDDSLSYNILLSLVSPISYMYNIVIIGTIISYYFYSYHDHCH